ncbi:gnat family protein [Stylonychia lemnae]|uniref:Gnat family protein n=1 Tax=Stylonychia lemnae TaxID=5949 RepID=A0A077ZTT7_STYLE|nr:gnat family protein [Stylonychia lemnae]|eukprot:CDW72979.1 gnat family protein [Stylonychia lemnae]
MGILEILKYYLYFLVVFFAVVGSYQEVMAKSSHINTAIRHYFGLTFFVEYTVADPNNLNSFEDEVAICDYQVVTPKIFFQEYVSKYRPCLFKNYGRQWPAYEKWTNESYLKEMAGEEIIYAEQQKDNRFAYFTEGAKRAYLTYGEFLDKFKEPNRKFHYYYSFEDPPGPLKNDIVNPPIMDSIFKYTQVTFWQGYGTLTKPHTDAMENMMCVFEGYKNFSIVAPHERKYVYAGYEGVPDNYSPVEFVNPDYDKWPDFKKAHLRTVHIAPGDCLYLPAYYWHQVGSSPGVSIGVATWYKTHHQAADFMQFAMQKHIV